MALFLGEINWPLGEKLTALRPFYLGRASGSSSQGQIPILGMNLFFLPAESHINIIIKGLLECQIHKQRIPF